MQREWKVDSLLQSSQGRDLFEERGQSVPISEGKAFQAEGLSSAKFLRKKTLLVCLRMQQEGQYGRGGLIKGKNV